MTKLTNEAANILLAKLYTALRTSDTSRICTDGRHIYGELTISYSDRLKSIWVGTSFGGVELMETETPTEWAMNGRKNWRAIKAFVAKFTAQREQHEAILVQEEANKKNPLHRPEKTIRRHLLKHDMRDWARVEEACGDSSSLALRRCKAVFADLMANEWKPEEVIIEVAQEAPESIAEPTPAECTQVEPEEVVEPSQTPVWVKPIPDGLMTRAERKEALSEAPKKKTANPTLGSLFAGTKKGNAQRKPNIPRKR
ncbi:MAG: hypothetical protein ACRCXB_15265 [Aeromonadaceae bacterium]